MPTLTREQIEEKLQKAKETMKDEYDFINPDHYKKGDMEVWEMMVAVWGKAAFMLHCQMCAFKYRMRLGEKPDQPVERDLAKAKWYEDKFKELANQ